MRYPRVRIDIDSSFGTLVKEVKKTYFPIKQRLARSNDKPLKLLKTIVKKTRTKTLMVILSNIGSGSSRE